MMNRICRRYNDNIRFSAILSRREDVLGHVMAHRHLPNHPEGARQY